MGLTLVSSVAATVPDAAEREQALDIGRSWIVEAPAGSGKTGLLIQRYLKLLGVANDPAEVLALTFTLKATAEMKERVLQAVRDAAADTPVKPTDFDRLTRSLAQGALQRDAEKGWQLLDRPYRLNIRTIDSLCSAIARAVPLLAGNGGVARPMQDAVPLYRRAARAVMLHLGGPDTAISDAIRTVLLHRDGDLPYCEGLIAEMLGTREQWGRLVPLSGPELDDEVLDRVVLPRLNDALQHTLCAALTHLHSCFPPAELERIAGIMQELAFAEGFGDTPTPFAECRHAAGAPGTDAVHIDHWLLVAHLLLTEKGGTWRRSFQTKLLKTEIPPHLQAEIKELIRQIGSEELESLLHALRQLPPAEYPQDQWRVAKALFRLLQLAIVELKLLFASEEVCDFSEVALAARAALESDAGEAQAAFGTPLCHLLVDEMQDTSSSQYELIRMLTAGWDGFGQTLFAVGDPKQSIYLFRQARVDLFQRCMREGRLGDVPAGVLRLSANFRSGQAIVGEFNAAFSRVFGTDEVEEGDVVYSEAHAMNPERTGEGIGWHIHPVPYDSDLPARRTLRARALKAEAQSIARRVVAWREAHPKSTIAVLTRARSHISQITRELAAVAVPYRAVEMDPLGERQEVLDVLSLTRALLHPADRTAWLAVLRAPWCGCDLGELFTLAAGDDRRHRNDALLPHLRSRAAGLPAASHARVVRTLDILDAAIRVAGTRSLADCVERVWRSLGGDVCTDATGRENVRQFFRLLDSMEAEGESVDIFTLQRRMSRLFAAPDSAADAVDVMTIHKAKGLEWDMVLVPGMHRTSAQNRWPLLAWLELPTGAGDTLDLILAPVPPKGSDPDSLNLFIRNVRKRSAIAELKRVFYVAATRARTSLHLFAWPDTRQSGDRVEIKETLLKIAQPAEPPTPAKPSAQPAASASPPSAPEAPLALAAAADPDDVTPKELPTVHRLPAGYDPLERLHQGALPVNRTATQGVSRQNFQRPEGSFGARAVGNAIHAFVERLGLAFEERLSPQRSPERLATELERELPGWHGAIRSTLRAGSLPPGELDRAANTVERALRYLVTTEEGRWLMLPHAGSQSEASWRSAWEHGTQRVRLDRSFFAGEAPGRRGSDTLWIVDFKTADRAEADREAFLVAEKGHYEPQLRTYAEVRLRALPPGTPVMLALAYPLMSRLVSWRYEADATPEPAARDASQLQLF